MTELEQLQEQRREINRKIAELKQKGVLSAGRAKLEQDKGYRKYWYVNVLSRGYSTESWGNGLIDRYCRVITAKDKDEILKLLPEIVRDLQTLYEMMKQDEVSEINARENGEAKEGDSE